MFASELADTMVNFCDALPAEPKALEDDRALLVAIPVVVLAVRLRSERAPPITRLLRRPIRVSYLGDLYAESGQT